MNLPMYVQKCWTTPIRIVRHVPAIVSHPVRTILRRMHRFWHPVRHLIHHYRIVGKKVRKVLRHHFHLSHKAARVVWHGSLLTCILVPAGTITWNNLPPFPNGIWPSSPPAQTIPVNVPEPSSLALFGVGVVCIVLLRRNRNAS